MHLLGQQRLQCEYPASRKQRSYHFEGWVLRGGPDKRNRPVLDVGQDHILLGLVKPVNFVDEQNGPLLIHPLAFPGLSDDTAQVGDARGDGAYRLEMGLRNARHQPRQGSFAAAGWTPEDAGRQPVSGNGPPQHPLLGDDVLLSNELFKACRADALG